MPHRLWVDTEFHEDGQRIELLSIGAVRDDGATFYAETPFAGACRAAIAAGRSYDTPLNDWVIANVVPHLQGGTAVRSRAAIAEELAAFAGESPEWWAAWGAYDWVAICQLYGRMVDLPDGWPYLCRDVVQWAKQLGCALPVQQGVEHHALADARWTHDAWRACDTFAAKTGLKPPL